MNSTQALITAGLVVAGVVVWTNPANALVLGSVSGAYVDLAAGENGPNATHFEGGALSPAAAATSAAAAATTPAAAAATTAPAPAPPAARPTPIRYRGRSAGKNGAVKSSVRYIASGDSPTLRPPIA